MVLEEREEVDKELTKKEQEQKDRELNKWLEDWEEHKSKDKEHERSSLMAVLGKPGSSIAKKREQDSFKKPGRSKRLCYQPMASDWGETAPPSLAGVEILDEPRVVELVEDTSPPSLGTETSGVTIPISTQNLVPDTTTTTTPPRTILDEARLKQPTIEGFLLPKWVETDIQTVTPPPHTNLTQEDNIFEEHESTTSPRIPLIQEVTVEDSRGSNTGGTPRTEVGTSTIRSASLPVTPSLVELTTSNGQEPCSFKRGGMCSTHNRVGTRSIKQTKCWKKKKDGSFGYITSKKVVYTCEFNEMRKPVIPVSCVISETDGDPNNGSNSDALLGLSSDLEVELTDRKMSESLPPD